MPDNFPGISGCGFSFDIKDWAVWSWAELGTISGISAGETASQTMFTVPDDERAYLDGAYAAINSGDNTISDLDMVYPFPSYGAGNGRVFLAELGTAGTYCYWPHVGQTINRGVGGPLLLEPGQLVRFGLSGAGAAATEVVFALALRRTKIIRQLVPD